MTPRAGIAALAMVLALLAGCDNMANQPRDKTWRPAPARGAGPAWPPVPPASAIAREDVPDPPPKLDAALLARGHERFDIFCSPCHGRLGNGDGIIVRRGFPAPPSFHSERLREAPTRHFYEVATEGYGAMYAYADRVSSDDRWAIAAYIRALQESRRVAAATLPADARERLP